MTRECEENGFHPYGYVQTRPTASGAAILPEGVPARELNRADSFTFEESGVGSEAEGFQHAGLHSL